MNILKNNLDIRFIFFKKGLFFPQTPCIFVTCITPTHEGESYGRIN